MGTDIIISIRTPEVLGLMTAILTGTWWIGHSFGSLKETVKNLTERVSELERKFEKYILKK